MPDNFLGSYARKHIRKSLRFASLNAAFTYKYAYGARKHETIIAVASDGPQLLFVGLAAIDGYL